MAIDAKELKRRFTYHSPSDDQLEKYERIREEAHDLALTIAELVPDGPEHHVAVRKIEEAVMYANAGIARRT